MPDHGNNVPTRRTAASRMVLSIVSCIVLCIVLAVALMACATGPPVPPAYTQEELAERCFRTGGWWHGVPPDSLFSGFCEYSSPGILR